MTNPYGGPVPVLGIQKTLKPQMLKMQGEMDFDDDKTNKSRNARNADGWKEGPTWKVSNRQKDQRIVEGSMTNLVMMIMTPM